MSTSPHATAEQVLRGHVTSLVKWTEFRQWMIDRHPDYLTDEELLDLYREHVTHRYDSGYRWSPVMCPGDTDFCPHNGCTTCQGDLFATKDPDNGAGWIPENDHEAWARLVTTRQSEEGMPPCQNFSRAGADRQDPDHVPTSRAGLARELAQREGLGYFEITLSGAVEPEDLFGPIDMERFSRTVRETKRETKPSLSKRAKKALRRAQRAARRHA